MSYEIRQNAVRGVVTETMQVLGNKGFAHGEILVGLGEVIGRLIVDVAQSPTQATELVTVVNQHLVRTIEAGQKTRESQSPLILPVH